MLFAWTPPANWTAIVGLNVNRNAAFRQSRRLGQRNATVDLVAVLVVWHRRAIVEVPGAETFVAVLLREHSFAFTIESPLKLACR